jgi:hypothetical protein
MGVSFEGFKGVQALTCCSMAHSHRNRLGRLSTVEVAGAAAPGGGAKIVSVMQALHGGWDDKAMILPRL